MSKGKLWFGLFGVLILLASCAIPSAPTGGPRDTQPPQLVEVSPQPGSVNVETQSFDFTFNEYVDRASFEQALTIEPRFEASFSTDWKRQRVTVRFEEPLPENRTIIFTIGTELRDTRGNKLKAPIQIPISTGPEIDQGVLALQVQDAIKGDVRPDESVFLFLGNGPLGPNGQVDSSMINSLGQIVPDYTIQSDTAGVATFQALGQQVFTPLWVNDVNRNRRWEPGRERAQSFEQNRITPSEGLQSAVWIYEPDTVAPRVQGVGVLALNQLRIRTSESLVLEGDSVEVFMLAENENFEWKAAAMLLEEDSSTVVITADSLESLQTNNTYILLLINNIADRSRNSLGLDSLSFNTNDVTEIVRPDTSATRGASAAPADLTQPNSSLTTAELLVVIDGIPKPQEDSLNDSLNADSVSQAFPVVARLELVEAFQSQTLVDTVLIMDVVDAQNAAEESNSARTLEPFQLRLSDLPPTDVATTVRLTLFLDVNGDGKWSFNANPAEPRRVVSNIQLLNDFEGTIQVSFSLF